MLFKGTETRTAKQISEVIDDVGGFINAYTDKEITCYYVSVLDNHVGVAIDVLSDMLLNSLFASKEISKEKNVILEEIKMREDDPDGFLHESFVELIYPNHNLGRQIIGYANTVSSFKSKDLIDYISTRYTPDSIVIVATGNLEHNQIVDLITPKFSFLIGSRENWRNQDVVPQTESFNKTLSKPIEQAHVLVGYPGYSCLDPNRFKLLLLNEIISGGMSSRLFEEIREKRGLAYSVGSYIQKYKEGGYFVGYAGTNKDSADKTIDLVKREFTKISKSFKNESELDRSKNKVKSSLIMAQESTSARMHNIGSQEINHNKIISIEDIFENIDVVNCRDISETAKEIFDPSKEVIMKLADFG